MLKNLDINAFKKPINYSLLNNLTEHTCSTLANMLAMDYATRLASQGIIEEYANICIIRLKNFLKLRVITDNSFATALTLFAVAISPNEVNFQNKNNILNQDKSQDAAVEALVNMHFSEHSVEEQVQIKLILRDVLNRSNAVDMLNYLNSEPKVLKSIISNSLKSSNKQKEINDFAITQINRVFQKNLTVEVKTTSFKQAAASLVTSLATLVAVATCVLTGGVALPLLIIPTAILSLKFTPALGEKLGEAILNLDNGVKQEKHYLNKLKDEIIDIVMETPIKAKQQVKNLSKEKVQNIFHSKAEKLATIKEQLQTHNSERTGGIAGVPIKKNNGKGGRAI